MKRTVLKIAGVEADTLVRRPLRRRIAVANDQESPIARHSLPSQIVERLRAEIVEGKWAPGERVTEQKLSELYGVSRTPLREALKIVEVEGLLVLLPNRGAVITEPTFSDTRDKLRVLGALEGLAAGLVCASGDDEDLAVFAKLHERMRDAHARKQARRYFEANDKVHSTLIAVARNPSLADLHAMLSRHIRRARLIANFKETVSDESMAEHEAIIAALLRRDAPAAKQAIEAHMETVVEKLMATAARRGRR